MNNITTNMPVDGASIPGMMSLGEVKDIKSLFASVGEILATSLKVTETKTPEAGATVDAAKAEQAAKGKVDIDAPDKKLMTETNLEALVAALKMAMDEKQLKEAIRGINNQKGKIDAEAGNRLQKINDNLKEMDKAAAAAKARRALGWLGVFVAAVVAIVSIATAGLAASLVPIVSFGLMATMQGLQESGKMEELVKKLAEKIKEGTGCSKGESQFWAGLVVAIGMMVVSGAATGVASVAGAATDMIKMSMSISQAVVGLGQGAAGIATTVYGQQSAKAQEDLLNTDKFLKALKKVMEQSEDDLEKLMQLLEDGISKLFDFANSKLETEAMIALKMREMA